MKLEGEGTRVDGRDDSRAERPAYTERLHGAEGRPGRGSIPARSTPCASVATGQQLIALGDLAQLVPPLAYAGFTLWLARQCRGQVRVFWNLNAMHGVIWAVGQAVWTYYDLFRGGVPVDLADRSACSSCRAFRWRPRSTAGPSAIGRAGCSTSSLLDLVLIALFSAFVYIYFVVSIAVTDGREELYNDNLTQLLNARNLLLALWAICGVAHGGVAGVAADARRLRARPGADVRRRHGLRRRRVAGAYAPGSAVGHRRGWRRTSCWRWPRRWPTTRSCSSLRKRRRRCRRLPVVSLIAIALLVAIPAIDEIARRLLDVSPATESLRTRLALAMMIPFGIVVVVREFLSRRALLRAGAGAGDARASSWCRRRSWRRSGSWCRAWRTS